MVVASKPAVRARTTERTFFNAEATVRLTQAGESRKDIKAALGISVSTIKRNRRHFQRTGEVRESRQGQGRKDDVRWVFAGPRGEVQLRLLDQIKDAGDAADLLKEVWAEFLVKSPADPSYRTLCRSVCALEYTRKLLSSYAQERDEHARNDFLHRLQRDHAVCELVFCDETAQDDRTLNRRYGWSKRGQPARSGQHFLLRGQRYSALGPFTLEDGFLDWNIIPGGFDADSFLVGLKNHVLPHMQPYQGRGTKRSVLVLDGASIHRTDAVLDAVFEAGCLLYFLPPYCPDLNPIEEAFHYAKNFLRLNFKALRDETPEDQIKMAFANVGAAGAFKAFKVRGPWI